MYKVFIAVLVLYSITEEVLLEECRATNGQIGQCVSIFSCPSLLWSFKNPRKGYDEYLQEFKCPNNNSVGLFVCCHKNSDILVFEDNHSHAKIDKVTVIENLDNCGLQNTADHMVQEGKITLYEFPWLVAITINKRNQYEHPTTISTGSLINSRYVLTDAASVINITDAIYFFVRIAEFEVPKKHCHEDFFSEFYVTQKCAQYGDYNIRQLIIHPFYDPITRWNNLALIELAPVVSFKSYNRPICLPTPKSGQLQNGGVLYLAGWNKSADDYDIADKWSFQRKIAITILPWKSCEFMFNKTILNDNYGICASAIENITNVSCNDVLNSQVMSFDGVRWNLEGLANMCSDNGKLIVYTKVNNYMPWIRQHTKNEKCVTPNGNSGECVYITDCPALMDAFANIRQKDEQYLRGFICGRTDVASFQFRLWRFPPVVCCSSSPVFTVPDKQETNELIQDPDRRLKRPLSEYCGLQNRDGYYLLKNNITTDEFPWVASIYKMFKHEIIRNIEVQSARHAGVLITSRYVVTGAFALRDFYDDTSIFDIVVRLGEYQITNNDDCLYFQEFESEDCSDVVDYGVEKRIFHPFFNIKHNLNDIALLRLNKTVVFTDYVRPICLPKPDFDLEVGEILYSTGWGSLMVMSFSNTGVIKKKIPAKYISNEQCRKEYLIHDRKVINTHHICTSYAENNTEVTCNTDTGGPLMTRYNRKWYLVGILSEITCENPKPQICTRITKYLSWIYNNIQETANSE